MLLDTLRDRGVALWSEAGKLKVHTAEKLTGAQRDFIRTHRDELLAELADQVRTDEREREEQISERLKSAPHDMPKPTPVGPVISFAAYRTGWEWKTTPTHGRTLEAMTRKLEGLFGADVKVGSISEHDSKQETTS